MTGVRSVFVLAAMLVLLSDDVCGPNMIHNVEAATCVCDSSSIEGPNGCTPCGADEVVKAGKCACPEGMAKSDGICKVSESGLGKACSAQAPCSDPEFPTCTDKGYCTKTGCETSADCGGDFTCATWETTPYCKRFPTGLGDSCASSADCAGNDATFCEPLQSHSCVATCDKTKNDCADGFGCCDLSVYGLTAMCVPTGGCPVAQ
jgi:hypothetical protein